MSSSAQAPKDAEAQAIADLIADIFCRVLEIDEIGPEDNFLELGGNSLMAMQVISLIRTELDREVGLSDFFDHLTVASLTRRLVTPGSSVSKRQPGTDSLPADSGNRPAPALSLYFFAGQADAHPTDRYRVVLDCARFADTHGFEAIWLPERHFNSFGGLFPNPAVVGAAVAALTDRVHIRGGSVVAPLHHPVRVAEEWSVLDNLSKGRIGVSFGSGFHPRDFVLAPDAFADRRKRMFDDIETIKQLWRGETYTGPDGKGSPRDVHLYPTPYSNALPAWLTTSRSLDTFREAGQRGLNILTALLRLTVEELAESIRIYRRARQTAGHDPETGKVTLMLHTFIGTDSETVRATVQEPLKAYLRSHMDHTESLTRAAGNHPSTRLSTSEKDILLDHALDRYLESGSLIGTPGQCQHVLETLKVADVDEIACLIDFGVPEDAFRDSLHQLAALVPRP
jgi:natural product biosynthesis luciferase-like monooxygenase protein